MRASTWPAFTTSPSLTFSSTSRPITADPMSAYFVATISPEAVTNDCKASTRATLTVSTAIPELPERLANTAAPPNTANTTTPTMIRLRICLV